MKLELQESTIRELAKATAAAIGPSELTISRLEGRHRIGDEELTRLVAFVRAHLPSEDSES